VGTFLRHCVVIYKRNRMPLIAAFIFV